MRPNLALFRLAVLAAGIAMLALNVSVPRLPSVSLHIATPSFHLSVSL